MGNHMDEELGYTSSSPLLATAPTSTKPQDEIDLPTLKRVQNMLEQQIVSYSTIDRLVVDEKDLTVKEQLAVNKAVAFHLTEIKLLVETVVANIREKYE
jgi:hypothetical protein